MKFDNSEVLNRIKENFPNTLVKRSLALPSQISFVLSEKIIKLYLPADSVIGNMQDDKSAFEGWSVIAKRWCGISSVEMEWEIPNDLNNGHYQRFLFRVKEFAGAYDWFKISELNKDSLSDLVLNQNAKYYCNPPSGSRTNENEAQGKESILERKFVDEGSLCNALKQMVDASFIERQLPVGLFKEKVSKETSIFTGGKSAIDLWGISKGNDLLIFELKAANNKKVGVISELFFYVSFMKYVQLGVFQYGQPIESCKKIVDTKLIRAFFLTPDLHPLIDASVLETLNNSSNQKITYDSITIKEDNTLSPTFLNVDLKIDNVLEVITDSLTQNSIDETITNEEGKRLTPSFSEIELTIDKYLKIKEIVDRILEYTELSPHCYAVIQGLLHDETASIKQAHDKKLKSQFLEIIIAYIQESLEDDCLSKEEISNVELLKQLFRIQEGEFIRIKPIAVQEILSSQIRKMFLDKKVDGLEAVQKVELQGLFDLSYDQFLKIYNAEAIVLIVDGVDPHVLDTFIQLD